MASVMTALITRHPNVDERLKVQRSYKIAEIPAHDWLRLATRACLCLLAADAQPRAGNQGVLAVEGWTCPGLVEG
jgi:hypothetical protein